MRSMLYHAGDRQHAQNIQINKVIGENEKGVFYFTEKTKLTFLANRILEIILWQPYILIANIQTFSIYFIFFL